MASLVTSEALPSNFQYSSDHQKKPNGSFISRLSSLVLSPNKKSEKKKKPSLLAIPRRLSALSTGGTDCDDVERLFRFFDEDGDGKISPAELRKCLGSSGGELSAEDAEAAVAFADSDGDGLLGFEDFARLVETEEGEEEEGRRLRAAFGVYEMEGRGCITPKSLGRALGRLGEARSIEECAAMIRRFDLNGDGVICFHEFKTMMLSST